MTFRVVSLLAPRGPTFRWLSEFLMWIWKLHFLESKNQKSSCLETFQCNERRHQFQGYWDTVSCCLRVLWWVCRAYLGLLRCIRGCGWLIGMGWCLLGGSLHLFDFVCFGWVVMCFIDFVGVVIDFVKIVKFSVW